MFGMTRDIGIDLGTASVLVYVRGKGIVLREPSVVAMDKNTGKLLKVGTEAQKMLGRTPGNIVAIRPLREGVISDYDMTERMLREFIRKVVPFRLIKPRMIICVPSGITEVEERSVIDAGIQAGARKVYLIEEPVAAAIGAGIDITKPDGHMVVDIGGGTSEVALISMTGIAVSQSVRVAGDAMNLAVQHYLREVFRLEVGENTAENVKKILGAALPQNNSLRLEVSGKDLVYGGPRVVTVTEGDICEALHDPVQAVVDTVLRALEKAPPALAADVYDNGLLMAGGGALLRGLDQCIARATHLKVTVDKDPLTTVLRGTAQAMLYREDYEGIFIN